MAQNQIQTPGPGPGSPADQAGDPCSPLPPVTRTSCCILSLPSPVPSWPLSLLYSPPVTSSPSLQSSQMSCPIPLWEDSLVVLTLAEQVPSCEAPPWHPTLCWHHPMGQACPTAAVDLRGQLLGLSQDPRLRPCSPGLLPYRQLGFICSWMSLVPSRAPGGWTL